MKRLVALLVAVGLVALSIVVRNVIDGDDGGGSASDDGGGGDEAEGPLVCATELEAACRDLADDAGLDLVLEDPGETAARLIGLDDGADPGLTAWLVPAPWPAIVADSRDRAGLDPVLGDASGPLARTGLVTIAPAERLQVLLVECTGQLLDGCLPNHASEPWSELGGESAWGVVRPGLADPTTTTSGLLGLQAVVAGILGVDRFARNDIETDIILTAIENLAAVEPNTTAAGSPFELLLRIGPGSYDVVVELAAVAEPAVAASARQDQLSVREELAVTVDVVLVAPEGQRSPLDLADVTAGLNDAGWDDASSGPATGTLNPGVYVALQEAWQEADR